MATSKEPKTLFLAAGALAVFARARGAEGFFAEGRELVARGAGLREVGLRAAMRQN